MILKNFVLIQGKHLPLYAATACFSLKTIQVLAHIYKGRIQEYPAGECAGYLLFFPSLFLGPLNSSRQFHQTWGHVPSVSVYRRLLVRGLKELFWGILYLLFIAHILSLPLQSLESRMPESPVFCQILLYACLYGARLFSIWLVFKDRCRVLLSSGHRIKEQLSETLSQRHYPAVLGQMADHFY